MSGHDSFPEGPSGPCPRRLAHALQVRVDVQAFTSRWPELSPGEPAPSFTWEAIERQLVDMAPSELQAEIVRGLLGRVRADAAVKPAEMVLREILKVSALVLEDPENTAQTAPSV
jgi:hypothetical protein